MTKNHDESLTMFEVVWENMIRNEKSFKILSELLFFYA